ncbi:alpha/beta fold hydrolase [Streptomyces collinus]|uniref:alpha/beta fold hydrolase n=1 Tax=Streptomyces collinus TaxID=42684 RepID=UPI0037D26958
MAQLSISTGAGAFDAIAAGPSEGHPALLHGFPQTGLVWQRQIEASAAHGYRVVALDQRGYPAAPTPSGPRTSHQPSRGDVITITEERGWAAFDLRP